MQQCCKWTYRKHFPPRYIKFRSHEDCSSSCCKYYKKFWTTSSCYVLLGAGGLGFDSMTPYQDRNQNQCLSTREFYRARPSNLTASDTQFTTYKWKRHPQIATSELSFTNPMDKISKLIQSIRQSPVKSQISMGMTGNSTG
jgi:hypothetical protein